MEGASSIDDENREEVDEDETTAATASSFTNRETPMRWKPHDIIKFYRVSGPCVSVMGGLVVTITTP